MLLQGLLVAAFAVTRPWQAAAVDPPRNNPGPDMLIAAAVDGSLHGMRADTGEWLWSAADPHGALVQARVSSAEPQRQAPWYIPEISPAGTLYVSARGRPLTSLGVTLPGLVAHSPFQTPDGTLYLGGKTTHALRVDPHAGPAARRSPAAEGTPRGAAVAQQRDSEGTSGPAAGAVALLPAAGGCLLLRTDYHLLIRHPHTPELVLGNLTLAQYAAQPHQISAGVEATPAGQLILRVGPETIVHALPAPVHTVLYAAVSPADGSCAVRRAWPPERAAQGPKGETPAVPDPQPRAWVRSWKEHVFALPEELYREPLGDIQGQDDAAGSVTLGATSGRLCPIVELRSVYEQHLHLQFDSALPAVAGGLRRVGLLEGGPVHVPLRPTMPLREAYDALAKAVFPWRSVFPDAGLFEAAGAAAALLAFVFFLAASLGRRRPKRQTRDAAASAVGPPGPLVISKVVLGHGSHGTVVFRGTFQDRPVAVKRLLIEYYDVAQKEIALLQRVDHHPNLVRYFWAETRGEFCFIALEECAGTLVEFVEDRQRSNDAATLNSDAFATLRRALVPRSLCLDVATGLAHLHSLQLVHRDLKPQNILVAQRSGKSSSAPRAVLSDLGLSKKLDDGQSSFHPTLQAGPAGGTSGWRAPEALSGGARMTKAVDLFALGCVLYYTLSGGRHPFGDGAQRDARILASNASFDALSLAPGGASTKAYVPPHLQEQRRIEATAAALCGAFHRLGAEDVLLAQHLMRWLIQHDPGKRPPDAPAVLAHPFFWTLSERLSYLQDVSDRYETEPVGSRLCNALEKNARPRVLGRDWMRRVGSALLDDLGKYRKYSGSSVRDLLRVLRNKKHHYGELPPATQQQLGALPDGFYSYFAQRFPLLLLHVWLVVQREPDLEGYSLLQTYRGAAGSFKGSASGGVASLIGHEDLAM